MKKIVIILFVVFLLGIVNSTKAEQLSADSLFALANKAYNYGLYDSAATTYHKILKLGKESAGLYYNLGNAYFKAKDIPSAILYYEKAKKLAPNNHDISYNLSIANSMIVDKIEKLPVMFYKKWWIYFYNLFNSDTWAVLLVISFAVFILFVGIFVLGNTPKIKRLSFFLGFLFMIISAIAFGLASQKYYFEKSHTEAIIFTPTVTVKSSPTANSVDLFVIHEGTKVTVLDKVDSWEKIKIQNGSIGWLPADDMKEI